MNAASHYGPRALASSRLKLLLAVWFHLLIGAAYAFHVTLTMDILRTRQTDITSQGTFFSTVIIFLGNIFILLIGLPLLTGTMGVLPTLALWLHETGSLLTRLGRVLQ